MLEWSKATFSESRPDNFDAQCGVFHIATSRVKPKENTKKVFKQCEPEHVYR